MSRPRATVRCSHEKVPYLEGAADAGRRRRPAAAAAASREIGDVYDHCLRAIDYTLARMGQHGLPLIGTGDWNDGLDAAGRRDGGEGTWLACFFYDILVRLRAARGQAGGRSGAARYRGRGREAEGGASMASGPATTTSSTSTTPAGRSTRRAS